MTEQNVSALFRVSYRENRLTYWWNGASWDDQKKNAARLTLSQAEAILREFKRKKPRVSLAGMVS